MPPYSCLARCQKLKDTLLETLELSSRSEPSAFIIAHSSAATVRSKKKKKKKKKKKIESNIANIAGRALHPLALGMPASIGI